MRLTEVLLLYASAERGPSGRRGPWLRTLGPSGGWRRRRDPEGLRRWFGFWSGKSGRVSGAADSRRPLVAVGPSRAGRRRTQMRELHVPRWEMGFGAVIGAAP